MSRDLPFFAEETCDLCGATGIYDFFGDKYCPKCTETMKILNNMYEYYNEEDEEEDEGKPIFRD